MSENKKPVKKNNNSKSKTSTKKVNKNSSTKKPVNKKPVKKETSKAVNKEEKVVKKEAKPIKKEEVPKKELLNNISVTEKEKEDMLKFIRNLLIIALGLGLIYFGMDYAYKFRNNKDNKGYKVDTILASSIFKEEGSYYVVIYDFKNKENEKLSELIDKANKKKMNIYKVDSSDPFNKDYITKENNKYDKNDLKVKNVTMLKVEKENILETFEDSKVNAKLNELSK